MLLPTRASSAVSPAARRRRRAIPRRAGGAAIRLPDHRYVDRVLEMAEIPLLHYRRRPPRTESASLSLSLARCGTRWRRDEGRRAFAGVKAGDHPASRSPTIPTPDHPRPVPLGPHAQRPDTHGGQVIISFDGSHLSRGGTPSPRRTQAPGSSANPCNQGRNRQPPRRRFDCRPKSPCSTLIEHSRIDLDDAPVRIQTREAAETPPWREDDTIRVEFVGRVLPVALGLEVSHRLPKTRRAHREMGRRGAILLAFGTNGLDVRSGSTAARRCPPRTMPGKVQGRPRDLLEPQDL